MSDKVWLVVGITGEWTGREEWGVVAYRDEDVANLHCHKCNEWLGQHGLHNDYEYNRQLNSNFQYIEYEKLEKIDDGELNNPYDPEMKVEYTGANYMVIEVPSFLHPDEFIEYYESKGR